MKSLPLRRRARSGLATRIALLLMLLACSNPLPAGAREVPAAAETLRREAVELSQQGSHAEALAKFEDVLRLSARAPAVVSDYVLILARSKQPEAAILEFEGLPDSYRASPELQQAVADAYRQLERYKDANRIYESLLEANPDDKDAARGLVLTLFDLGKSKEALLMLEQLAARLEVPTGTPIAPSSHQTPATAVRTDKRPPAVPVSTGKLPPSVPSPAPPPATPPAPIVQAEPPEPPPATVETAVAIPAHAVAVAEVPVAIPAHAVTVAEVPVAVPEPPVAVVETPVAVPEPEKDADRYRRLLAENPGNAAAAVGLSRELREEGNDAGAIEVLDATLAHSPDAPALLHDKASLQMKMGRAEDALATYEAILAKTPGDRSSTRAALRLLTDLAMSTSGPQALEYLSRAVRISDDPSMRTRYALALAEDGDPDGALNVLNDGLKVFPENIDLLFLKAELETRSRAHESALKTYSRILAIDPESSKAASEKAHLLVQVARFSDCGPAVDMLATAARLVPDSAKIETEYILALAKCGRTPEAVARYEALPASFDQPPHLTRIMADGYRSMGEHDDAVELYRKVLERLPDDPASLSGMTQSLAAGSTETALRHLEKAVRTNPESLELLLAKAKAEMAASSFSAGLATCDNILALDPGSRDAEEMKASLYAGIARHSDCDAAAGFFEKALLLTQSPDRIREEYAVRLAGCGNAGAAIRQFEALGNDYTPSPVLLKSAAGCYGDLQEFARAVPLYETALRSTPDDEDTALALVDALHRTGHAEEALGSLAASLNAMPESTALLFKRAALEKEQGAFAKQLGSYERILTIAPDNAEAAELACGLLTDLARVSEPDVAVELLGKARLLNGDSPEILADYIIALAALERPAEIVNAFEESGEPDVPTDVLKALAAAYQAQGDATKAVALYASVCQANPRDAQSALGLASALTESGRLKEAALALDRALEALPNETDLLFAKADLETELIRYSIAIDTYGKILAILPGDNRARSEKGRLLLEVARFSECGDAIEFARQAVELTDGAGAVHLEYVRTLTRCGADERAIDEYSRIPRSTEIPIDLTLKIAECCRNTGDAARALAIYTELARKDASNREAHLGVVRTHIETRQFDKALKAADRGLDALPEDADLLFTKAVIAAETANYMTAVELCDRILATTPGHGKATELKARLLPDPATMAGSGEPGVRSVRVSLDVVYDSSPERVERNLDELAKRLVNVGVNTVVLTAFSDLAGHGNAESVFFPNRNMHVRSDLLGAAVERLHKADLKVFASLPVLSFELPDQVRQTRLLVKEWRHGGTRPCTSGEKRLSPFSAEVLDLVTAIYADMASSAPLDGVVFGKDAFLSDVEDFHPEAQAAYREALDITTLDPEKLSEEECQAWTAVKRRRLTEFTRQLMTAVREQLPKAEFARDIYAPVLYYPESEEWLAQNFSDAMTTYNWVYVVASPELEGVALVSSWMDKLLERAAQHPGGLEKAVFDLQAFDGQRQRWVSDRSTGSRMRKLVERGARHISYGPDNFAQDRPGGKYVREAMTWQPNEKRR